jgi:putative mRNA 3-end processing factor
MALLEFTKAGIYCPQADVHIDPWRKVKRALITHGHSDHARTGHSAYLCSETSVPILRHRLGKISVEGMAFGQVRNINGVNFSFHPAGHIIGSAQVRVEYQDEVWVASGDYKTVDDGFSEAFEPVACHTFITESTFGLPVYQWKPQAEIIEEIDHWWKTNRSEGRTSVIGAYSLGKAQRIIANVDASIGKIFCHGAVEKMNKALREAGGILPETAQVVPGSDKQLYAGALIVAPPSALGSDWMKNFRNTETASASGWMQLRGRRRWGALDKGFVLSDHADWPGLNAAINATGAETVYVTHGYTEIFSRWLKERGYDARTVNTKFGEEEAE